MAVQASPEAIRQMRKEISNTIKDIEKISSGIRNGLSSGSWNDAQGMQFKALMQKISQLAEQPKDQLAASLPKLEQLASSLERYNKVQF